MGSLFVYKLSTVLNLTNVQIDIVEKLFREFLWCGKKPKISLVTLKKSKKNCGMRLVDISAKQDSIKISWIFRIQDNVFLLKCCENSLDPTLGQNIWICNLKNSDVKRLYDCNTMWGQMLYAWSKINFHTPTDYETTHNQFLWLNSHIKIEGKPCVWGHWLKNGIWYIKDLLHANGKRKTARDLNVNWLELRTLWLSIPDHWNELLSLTPLGDHKDLYHSLVALTRSTRNRKIYDSLINDPGILLKYGTRWLERNLDFEWEEYQQSFDTLFACTKASKFRDFQYRLLLGKNCT